MIALYTALTVLGALPIVLPAVAFLVLVVAGLGMGERLLGEKAKASIPARRPEILSRPQAGFRALSDRAARFLPE